MPSQTVRRAAFHPTHPTHERGRKCDSMKEPQTPNKERVVPHHMMGLLRKEVIQPHLPVRLPCYDFVPIASPTFDGSLHKGWATGFGCCRLS